MWSTRVDSESPYSCGHFDTKIEVVTMKKNRARFFNAVNLKCNLVGGEPPMEGEALGCMAYKQRLCGPNIWPQFTQNKSNNGGGNPGLLTKIIKY